VKLESTTWRGCNNLDPQLGNSSGWLSRWTVELEVLRNVNQREGQRIGTVLLKACLDFGIGYVDYLGRLVPIAYSLASFLFRGQRIYVTDHVAGQKPRRSCTSSLVKNQIVVMVSLMEGFRCRCRTMRLGLERVQMLR
jgi:hypothetical protein